VTADYGSTVEQFITNSPVTDGGTQYVVSAGTTVSNGLTQLSTTNVTLTLTNDAALIWQWQTNYQLFAVAGEHGSLQGASNGWYPLGGSITITAMPDTGWRFTDWTGSATTDLSVLTLAMGQACIATARFEQINYTISTSHGPNGTVAPGGIVTVASGSNAAFSFVPAPYYHVTSVVVDGETLDPTGTFVFADVATNHSLGAYFGENLGCRGTPEWWLALHGLTNGALCTVEDSDADRDGLPAWAEWIAGTDPTNERSVLAITGVNRTPPAGHLLQWSSVSNRIYSVEMSTNGAASEFVALATNLPALPPLNVYTDAVSAASRVFYRVRVVAP
jgi:hypothetical protein